MGKRAQHARLLPVRAPRAHAEGRTLSTPYHLAHGLLDHAHYLTRMHDGEAAEAALGEARDIGARLRCQPLLDRAADLTPARPPVQT